MTLRLSLTLLAISPGLLFCQDPATGTISDLIAPGILKSGVADTLEVRDWFIADVYDLRFEPHPPLTTAYEAASTRLIITPDARAEGLTLLAFRYRGDEYHVPVKIIRLQSHTFRFSATTPVATVRVIGSFNGWNRQSALMQDDDDDGEYTITASLEPGRYEYKFYVDGQELIDAANPDSVSNPFGQFNSVLTIKPRHPQSAFLHLLGWRQHEQDAVVSFYFEGESPPRLSPHEIIALRDNHKIVDHHLAIAGDTIHVRVENAAVSDEVTLRVGVSRAGQATPLQTVRLRHGQPAGRENAEFSWEDAILYSIMIDRFLDGDTSNTRRVSHPELHPKANYHGGDLAGIIQKIEEGYFDELGVNVLWLSPANQNTDKAHREYPPPYRYFSAYHGYWPVHHQRVDDRFGDLAMLRRLVHKAHARGLKVLIDFVANHVHEDHPFFQQHRDWFGQLELPDGRLNLRFWDEYRLTTWFEPFLPSFDYLGSDSALQTMTGNAIWWLQQAGLDGFRHDAVKHVPNSFWRTLTRKIRAAIEQPQNRRLYQIGETFGSYDLISSYVNNGQLSAQFNFNLYEVALWAFLTPAASFAALETEMQRTFAVYGMHHLMGNMMDSHDKARFMAYADGDLSLGSPNSVEIGWNSPPRVDDPRSYDQAALFLAYTLTIPGIPTIYYGDEIGMSGAADPDNRRPMRFGEQLTADEQRMLREVKSLVALRNQHPALRYGDFYALRADTSVYAYLRSDLNERLLVVLNKSQREHEVHLDLPAIYNVNSAHDLHGDEWFAVTQRAIHLRMAPVSWRVIQLASKSSREAKLE